jgi:hypothetical protein
MPQFQSWRGCDAGKAPPNPWRIATEEAQVIALITPGDFTHAFNKMNAPAEQMELRSDTYTVTYANADLTDTIKVFERYELRMLTADKIRAETRQDPL